MEVEAIPPVEPELAVQESASTVPPAGPFPWRSLPLFLGLIGQRLFEPPPTTYPLGYAFYIGAFILLGWAIRPASGRSIPCYLIQRAMTRKPTACLS